MHHRTEKDWTPSSSREMLEAAYRGALDREMLKALDEDWDLTCEHVHHAEEPQWHSDGPVSFVLLPCGRSGFRCLKWIESVREVGYCRCQCTPQLSAHGWDQIRITSP